MGDSLRILAYEDIMLDRPPIKLGIIIYNMISANRIELCQVVVVLIIFHKDKGQEI